MKTKKADNDNERKKVTKQGNTQGQSYVHGNTQPQPLLGFYLLRLLWYIDKLSYLLLLHSQF